MGVVHRDIKPANLMLDAAGHLWVTDFGLAKLDTAANLTVSGDLLGTLRYMSPEQALARHGLVDHRTDVYSLAATLYELLTLRPAVDGADKQETLRKIAFEEPTPPRKLDKAIPAELETVTLKSLAKNPAERYATAGELADDLRRWLDHQTIKAKPPTLRQRVGKWARRHRPLVGAAATVLLLAAAMLGSGLTWLAQDAAHRRHATERVGGAALADADQHQGQYRWVDALDAARRAEDALSNGADGADLRRRVESTRAGLELVVRLEEIRLAAADGVRLDMVATKPTSHFDGEQTRRECARAFRDAGIDLDGLTPGEVAERIPPALRVPVAAALDDWVSREDDAGARRMRAVAEALDPDPWRGRLREAAGKNNPSALLALAAEAQVDDLPPSSLARLGLALQRVGAADQAIAILRRAQRRHRADFWINYALGACLRQSHSPDAAIRFFTAAVALRPRSPGVHNNLGLALVEARAVDEASAAYRGAIRLNPTNCVPHFELGKLLERKGDLDEAITEMREGVRIAPLSSTVHLGLAYVLARKGLRDEAIAEFRRSLDSTNWGLPAGDRAIAHVGLGRVLEEAGLPDEAMAAYRDAFNTAAAAKANTLEAFTDLGKALQVACRYEKAVAAYREAIRLMPDQLGFHSDLAFLLATCPDPAIRNPSEAVVHAERAVKLGPKNFIPWTVLGTARYRAGNWAGAVEALNKSRELKGFEIFSPYDNFFLAMAHWQLGDRAEARTWYAIVARWIDDKKLDDDELRRFRAEAADLLGIMAPPREK
jgi:tetratricopeptide (TPR) repeat protein